METNIKVKLLKLPYCDYCEPYYEMDCPLCSHKGSDINITGEIEPEDRFQCPICLARFEFIDWIDGDFANCKIFDGLNGTL